MATVTVPSLMRNVTGGAAEVEGQGNTVAEVIEGLDVQYPGFRERLIVGADLDPALIAVVDGRPVPLGLKARVQEDSHIRFLPAVGGG